MSDSTANMQDASAQSMWWMPLVMGIVAIFFGLLLLAHPAETSIWVAWLIGIYWFVGGIMNLVLVFVDKQHWGWRLALGILGLLAGFVVLDAMSKTPLLATIGLAGIYVFILGIQGVVYGVIEIIQAFRGAGWGVGTLGVLSVLFGGWLLFNPFLAGLALPWVVAIFAIVGGIAAIVMAFKVKNA
jgi:uncharacterized membrane protein HdeD (DUF308 family)